MHIDHHSRNNHFRSIHDNQAIRLNVPIAS